ncbi:DUF1132 family protein [Neisseria meningitidis]|nr:DUF1132 family protein [Neisseria meningitidis]MBH2061668.1 DUF1132 family protein [Neisseria meningitidis]MBH2081973.1 DUF1132 family protein [Neisseria meningitidis]MBH2163700.1 DUF1132 family protein [Neisseria meningitidis]MBH2289102.1 DUF1132 family protein [Neisseria meningitidis]
MKHDIWLISFSDNSEMVIKESLKDGHKIYKFEFCEIVDNCNFDDVFV